MARTYTKDLLEAEFYEAMKQVAGLAEKLSEVQGTLMGLYGKIKGYKKVEVACQTTESRIESLPSLQRSKNSQFGSRGLNSSPPFISGNEQSFSSPPTHCQAAVVEELDVDEEEDIGEDVEILFQSPAPQEPEIVPDPGPGPSKLAGPIFGCSFCPRRPKFWSQDLLLQHEEECLRERVFPCSSCNLRFKSAKARYSHIRHFHRNHKPRLCPTCGKAFRSRWHMERHRQTHLAARRNAIVPTGLIEQCVCEACGLMFMESAARDEHRRSCRSRDALLDSLMESIKNDPEDQPPIPVVEWNADNDSN